MNTIPRALNTVLALIVITAWMYIASVFDAELAADQPVNQQEAAQARRDFAAQEICGPNSAFEWVSDKTLQCFSKHGRRAGKQVQL